VTGQREHEASGAPGAGALRSPGASHLTVFGAKTPLREGQIRLGDEYGYESRYYIGGQGLRSADVAWSLIDRLSGDFVAFEIPSVCASLRFGNCLSVCAYRDVKPHYDRIGAKP
jgi:hypothetical protein